MAGKNQGNWFDDDPEWAALRYRLDKKTVTPVGQDIARPNKREAAAPQPPPVQEKETPEKNHQISVNITLPKVSIPRIKIPKPMPRKVYVGGTVALCALILLSGLAVFNSKKHTAKGGSNTTNGVLSDTSAKPDFKVILPDGNQGETENNRVAYDPQKKVASFTDKIGLVTITVSQQPLPDNFKSDPEKQLETVATGFSATEVIVASNPKAYLGTSVKGPQTAIFYRYDVLVFIQSAKQISKADWTDYIRSLR